MARDLEEIGREFEAAGWKRVVTYTWTREVPPETIEAIKKFAEERRRRSWLNRLRNLFGEKGEW